VDDSIFVGLDVHKATVSVAVAEASRGDEVRHVGVVANRPDHIGKLVERLAKGGRRLSFCYEAGPCGYGLYRQLTGLGHTCLVVAPSLIPMKAGDRGEDGSSGRGHVGKAAPRRRAVGGLGS
jgi:transposase